LMPVGPERTFLRARETEATQSMHDTTPTLDAVAEWQHCQFVRHAQDPRRVEWQEAEYARF